MDKKVENFFYDLKKITYHLFLQQFWKSIKNVKENLHHIK
jgi:hypothetical protein